MKSGEDTTCNRDKEDRDKVVRAEIIAVQHTACIPVIPYLSKRESKYENPDKYSDCGEQKDRTEDRVDPSDDLIDREYSCDQVIYKDYTVDHPCGHGCYRSIEPEHLSRRNISRRIDEHRAYEEKQKAAEDLVKRINTFVAVLADHIRHLRSAVAQTDHTGKVIVHRSADNVSDRDRDKRDRSEQDALDWSEYRACSRDVQQIDQTVLPPSHRYIVYTVLFRIGRSLPVVRTKYFLAELSVERSSHEKNHETNDKCNH